KALRIQAAEVANARKRDVDQAVKEFIHAGATKGYLRTNRHTFADLKASDGVASLGDDCLLAGNRGEVGSSNSRLLRISRGFANAHVDDDLFQLGDHHLVCEGELLLQRAA